VIGPPLGEARPDGRARDMLVASRIIPPRLIQCCRPLEQTAMARMMRRCAGPRKEPRSRGQLVPVRTTNHLTQQPHVKNPVGQDAMMQLKLVSE
jgi:hypothetical protein